MNGSIEELTATLDGANNITNNNALSMSDLGEAMSIVGSQAASSGMKVNETTAAVSTMIAVTQRSGSEMANAFKGILMNLQQVTGEVGDGGDVIDTESLTKYEKACAKLGVSLSEVKNGVVSLREPMEIIKELSEAYTQLDQSDARRANLLSAVGGKYRANALNAILENYDMYEKMLQEYADGLGSMDEEAEKTAKSWEGRLNALSNSFTSFINDMVNKEAVLSGVTFLDKLIQGAESLVDTFGTIPTVLTAINSSMVAMNKDYGLTKIWDKETKKIDLEGNIFGIDFTAIKNLKNQKKHFEDATIAISDWNCELARGKNDLEAFENACVKNSVQLKEYLSTCSKDAPASLKGYRDYLQSTGQATDEMRAKTILLNSALTLLGSIAVQTVIKGIATAIDEFNVTVEEAQESVDGVNSKISDLKSQLEELNNLEYKSDFDKQKISQLERELELQEKILDVEQKRLYQNQIGTSFSDYFDKDSLITKQQSEYDRYNKEGYKYLSVRFETDKESLAEVESEIDSLRNRIDSGSLTGHEQFETEGKLEKLTEKRNELLKEQQFIEEQLTLNMGEYLKNYQTAQEAVDSGLLTDSDLEKAQSMAEYWNQLYQDSSNIVTNIQKMGGRYDNTNDLLEEKFGNISRDDLVSLSDDDKRIALSFDPNNEIGFDELKEMIEGTKGDIESLNDIPITFNITDHNETIDNIRSTLSTLRSALDAFNSDTMDESMVLDLMQQFPSLIPYIDLASDGFGNLSEGLSVLIAQQPESLIQSLQTLKESLNTDEEREYVDLLIDSLQALSSYGDSGIEAYATTIGSTWTDTANVIEGVTTQFENLAKVQEAVANGLTISTAAAAELAQMYPEILTNAIYAGNGQITLNEEVVKSILAGDESIINAQITKLEADKAELEAKKETAIAELEIANQVGTAKGQIDEATARNKIALLNQELENEISKNNQVGQSYAQTAESMAKNTEQLGNYNAEVSDNMATNMNTASASMADGMAVNSEASQHSLSGLAQKATDVANAVLGIATGNPNAISNPNAIYKGRGGTNKGGIKAVSSPGKFSSVTNDYLSGELSLDEFKSGLEIDISAYEKAISNIDSQIDILKNLQATFTNTANSANGGIGGHDYANKIKDLEKEKDKINSALDDAKKGSSAKETKDIYEELFDFFERRIKVLDNALALLKTNLNNVTGAFAKNRLIDAELGVTEEKFRNYSDALNMYTQKANEALSKLPSDIASKIKDGAVDLTTFIGDGNKDVVEAIKEYEQWADKVADCKQELAELKTAIRQLELEKFNNIMEDFTNQFDLHEDGKGLIEKQIALLKEAGELIGESFFTSQIDQSKKQLAILEEEKKQLVDQMASAVSSGRVEKSSKEWLEMARLISDVEGSILDCKKSIEEFDNELLQLHWDIFDRIQGQFKDLDSELSNLQGLFDEFNDIRVSDGNGIWTKEAVATLGLLTQQYELAQYQIQQYNDAIADLNAAYSAGKYSATEYVDKLSELSSEQWDAVNSSEAIKDAIIDLNETRINEEIDAIEDAIKKHKELTDSLIENLEAERALHDYKKSIEEKTSDLTDLDRQIAAVQNDTSAAGIARLKLLQDQRKKTADELSELEYQHSIDAQKDALNKQYENYETERNKEIEALKASLEEREALIAASFETVKQNANLVGQEIATIATEHGITVSNAIITSWQNGETAIASYGEVLSAGTSAFIENLTGVEYEVYNLQAQADATANTLAWMFATRADNLVGELAASYYSEQNLNAMTQALHDSLINTLEGGYNISGITSALDGIASGLNGVASAARNAANAMAAVGAAQSGMGSGSGNSYSGSSGERTLYKLEGVAGGTITSYNKSDLEKLSKSYGKGTVVPAYASGTRNAKAGLRVVNEEGEELTLPKLPSGEYAVGNEGDQILTKDETDNISEWAKTTPEEFAEKEEENRLNREKREALIKYTESVGGGLDENGNIVFSWKEGEKPRLFRSDGSEVPRDFEPPKDIINAELISHSLEKIVPESLTRQLEIEKNVDNSNVNIHYDSLVNIQGDVIDGARVVKQIEDVADKAANKAVEKSWHDFELTRKYGIY